MLQTLSLVSIPKLRFYAYLFLVSIIILITAAYTLLATRPTEQYIAYNPKTQAYQELQALDRPNVSTKALLSWASVAATATYTLDFLHAEDNLRELKSIFTRAGYAKFLNAIEKSGRLKDIKDQKLILSAVPYGPAVITKEGMLKEVYSWEIQIPMILTYQGASRKSTEEKIIAILLITRVPTSDAPKGIGIAQIVERKTS